MLTLPFRFDARPRSRLPLSQLLHMAMNVLKACGEAVAEAREMRREAQRRYPHLDW